MINLVYFCAGAIAATVAWALVAASAASDAHAGDEFPIRRNGEDAEL